MKAMMALAVPILALVGLFPSGSAFRGVESEEAAQITGGACYRIVVHGCQRVINVTPDGVYILDGAGCDDTAAGNKETVESPDGFTSSGTGRWCSFWHTWSCGMYVYKRPFCAQAIDADEVPAAN